jgi:hypothetical protein
MKSVSLYSEDNTHCAIEVIDIQTVENLHSDEVLRKTTLRGKLFKMYLRRSQIGQCIYYTALSSNTS